jgi:hypothetical protein
LCQPPVQQSKSGLAFQQSLGHPTAIFDVLDDAQSVQDVAIGIADRRDVHIDPQWLPGLAQKALFDLNLRRRSIDQGSGQAAA